MSDAVRNTCRFSPRLAEPHRSAASHLIHHHLRFRIRKRTAGSVANLRLCCASPRAKAPPWKTLRHEADPPPTRERMLSEIAQFLLDVVRPKLDQARLFSPQIPLNVSGTERMGAVVLTKTVLMPVRLLYALLRSRAGRSSAPILLSPPVKIATGISRSLDLLKPRCCGALPHPQG